MPGTLNINFLMVVSVGRWFQLFIQQMVVGNHHFHPLKKTGWTQGSRWFLMPPQKTRQPSVASSFKARPSFGQNKSDINGIRDSMRAGTPGEVKQFCRDGGGGVFFFFFGLEYQIRSFLCCLVVFFIPDRKWLFFVRYTQKKAEFQ